MITNLYFVDVENIGLKHLAVDTDCSKVFYFYSKKTVAEDRIKNFLKTKNEVLVEIEHNGLPNALDFVIDSYLGYQIRNYGRRVSYHIVSGDKGYENVALFWENMGYNVESEENVPIVPKYFGEKEKADIETLYRILPVSIRKKYYNTFVQWSTQKKKKKIIELEKAFGKVNAKKCLSKNDAIKLAYYVNEFGFPEDARIFQNSQCLPYSYSANKYDIICQKYNNLPVEIKKKFCNVYAGWLVGRKGIGPGKLSNLFHQVNTQGYMTKEDVTVLAGYAYRFGLLNTKIEV